MEKQILSDKEIESIIQFKRNRKSGIRIVDLYHALNEEFGLYEAEKSILSIMDKSIVLTEYEKKRALLEERACLTTGDIKYNPEYLRCPKCGCKYVIFISSFLIFVKLRTVLLQKANIYQRRVMSSAQNIITV